MLTWCRASRGADLTFNVRGDSESRAGKKKVDQAVFADMAQRLRNGFGLAVLMQICNMLIL